MVVSLNCDRVDSLNPAFEKAADTAVELLRIAREVGVDTNMLIVPAESTGIKSALPLLFQGNIVAENFDLPLSVYQTDSLIDECHAAAERIAELVQKGYLCSGKRSKGPGHRFERNRCNLRRRRLENQSILCNYGIWFIT